MASSRVVGCSRYGASQKPRAVPGAAVPSSATPRRTRSATQASSWARRCSPTPEHAEEVVAGAERLAQPPLGQRARGDVRLEVHHPVVGVEGVARVVRARQGRHLLRSEPERHRRCVGPGPARRAGGELPERGTGRRGVEPEGERRGKAGRDRRLGGQLLIVRARRWTPLPEHRGLERWKLPAALHPAPERHQRLAGVSGVGLGVTGHQRRDQSADRRSSAPHGTAL
jgi:hypothetical protein